MSSTRQGKYSDTQALSGFLDGKSSAIAAAEKKIRDLHELFIKFREENKESMRSLNHRMSEMEKKHGKGYDNGLKEEYDKLEELVHAHTVSLNILHGKIEDLQLEFEADQPHSTHESKPEHQERHKNPTDYDSDDNNRLSPDGSEGETDENYRGWGRTTRKLSLNTDDTDDWDEGSHIVVKQEDGSYDFRSPPLSFPDSPRWRVESRRTSQRSRPYT